MNIELEKFITDLDEHFKKLPVTDKHVKQLIGYLGEVVVRREDGEEDDVREIKLKDVIDVSKCEEEMKKIIQGNRADMIYEYQAFVEDFVNAEEKEEDE
jgi:hypothetical protein